MKEFTELTLGESLKLRLRFLALDNRGDDDTLVVDIGRFLAFDKAGFLYPLHWSITMATWNAVWQTSPGRAQCPGRG